MRQQIPAFALDQPVVRSAKLPKAATTLDGTSRSPRGCVNDLVERRRGFSTKVERPDKGKKSLRSTSSW
jgi:hypothetical protein